MPLKRVYIGFDANEIKAVNVAEASLRSRSRQVDIRRISRGSLPSVYTRPTTLIAGQLYDVISDAPMSTDHALARFWIPFLCDYAGWALFTDGDVLFRRDIADLFAYADERYAVMCVQHPASVGLQDTKKAGAVQSSYPKKNWSSVMLWNCGHFANRSLTLEYLNKQTGRRLHGFAWLAEAEIGCLPKQWNYLVGERDQVSVEILDPAIVHYTLGVPSTPGYDNSVFADEWWNYARIAGYRRNGG